MIFYLGAHHGDWLDKAGVPLFVSRATLANRRVLPEAIAPWALDSGGFTELTLHGGWHISAEQYAREVERFALDVGQLDWAAPQDWMCEPQILKRTRLTVADHQRRTLDNYLQLRELAPELPWIPVLQGWALADYWRHVEAYYDAGVDLAALDRVGVGSVCRRQNTVQATNIVSTLAGDGLRLHAFGFKVNGLRAAAQHLASADSMAWSLDARRARPMPGHTHKSCANCLEYALQWRSDVLGSLSGQDGPVQRPAAGSSMVVAPAAGSPLISPPHERTDRCETVDLFSLSEP